MNEKIEFRFWGIEVSDNYFCILILNWNIPQNVVVKPSGKAEYVEIYNKIHRYVVTEKHFLDKDINIDIIVRQCNVKKKSLNKILRLKDDVAFHGYINRQRVISRTFVRNFKVVYNMTPSEYRRRNGLKNI